MRAIQCVKKVKKIVIKQLLCVLSVVLVYLPQCVFIEKIAQM